jgi:hypothetical protein
VAPAWKMGGFWDFQRAKLAIGDAIETAQAIEQIDGWLRSQTIYPIGGIRHELRPHDLDGLQEFGQTVGAECLGDLGELSDNELQMRIKRMNSAWREGLLGMRGGAGSRLRMRSLTTPRLHLLDIDAPPPARGMPAAPRAMASPLGLLIPSGDCIAWTSRADVGSGAPPSPFPTASPSHISCICAQSHEHRSLATHPHP